MNLKNPKIIVIAVLGIAGLLGVLAVGIALYYNSIEDVAPSPIAATIGQNKCTEITLQVKDSAGGWVTPGPNEATNIDQELLIGATFQTPLVSSTGKGELQYSEFKFTINSSEELTYVVKIDDKENPVKTEDVAGTRFYFPNFVFNDWELLPDGTTSLTLSVIPYGTGLAGEVEEMRTVQACLPVIYELVLDGASANFTCVLAGNTQTDFCYGQENDEECNIPTPQCCEGLVRVNNCAVPNSSNQCPVAIPNCFICLESTTDQFCDADLGENVCNSPDDCEAEDSDDEDNDDEDSDDEPPAPKKAVCGNGIVEDGEQCDDGNITSNDGCSATCQTESSEPPPITPPPAIPPTPPGTGDTSNFSVALSSPVCVERVAPLNEAEMSITVTNNDSTNEIILDVLQKLPLGFTYVAGSASIDGVLDSTGQFGIVTVVGNSQQIKWSKSTGWSVAPGGTLTIRFKALAGASALTGDVQSEVIVTPKNIPVSNNTLRAESVFPVSQNCATPQTSFIGDIPLKVVVGLMTILVALVLYLTSAGEQFATNIVGSGPARMTERSVAGISDAIRMSYLRLTEPRRYFEKKLSRKIDSRDERKRR